MEEHLVARGHEHVRATHPSTLEVTTDQSLTPAGDCIVGVAADRAPSSFDPAFVAVARDADARVVATIRVGPHEAVVTGRGDPSLTYASDRGAVVRTSTYVDDRTVLVEADAAAADLDRHLVQHLQSGAELEVTLSVDP
ncbi:MAG: DUF371 domain-containing protein [Halobacteriales archaeon]